MKQIFQEAYTNILLIPLSCFVRETLPIFFCPIHFIVAWTTLWPLYPNKSQYSHLSLYICTSSHYSKNLSVILFSDASAHNENSSSVESSAVRHRLVPQQRISEEICPPSMGIFLRAPYKIARFSQLRFNNISFQLHTSSYSLNVFDPSWTHFSSNAFIASDTSKTFRENKVFFNKTFNEYDPLMNVYCEVVYILTKII